MSTNLTALQSAIKLVADAAMDSVKAIGDSNTASKMAEYENLIPDLMALVPQIGQIPAEASALQPADYAALIQILATDLALPAGHVEGIITVSLKLLTDIVTVIVPDVQALIAAIQAK